MPDIRPQVEPGMLLDFLRRHYEVGAERVELMRARGGFVYDVEAASGRYVLKVYRQAQRTLAKMSFQVLEYLREQDFPAVRLVPSRAGEPCAPLRFLEEDALGALFPFVQGKSPSARTEIEALGGMTGRLHRLMEAYPGALPVKGRAYFVDRFTALYREAGFDPGKRRELEAYGDALCVEMEALPAGFCHGDLHTGNLLRTADGTVVPLDFDAILRCPSVNDIGTLCDASNFFQYTPKAYGKTRRRLDRFLTGYTKERGLSRAEAEGAMDFIALRHYEIIPTVLAFYGVPMSPEYQAEQFDWLMCWREDCRRERGGGGP